jgi:negative regulator of sigma E activity
MVARMKTADHCRKRAADALENEDARLSASLREEWLAIAQEWTSFAIMLERREARVRAKPGRISG